MKRNALSFVGLIFVSFLLVSSLILTIIPLNRLNSQDNNGVYKDFDLRMNAQYGENITVLSDGFNGVWGWNDGWSEIPDIAVDGSGNIHVVWVDDTIGYWGGGIDSEIFYAKYTIATSQWSNITIISDGFNDMWGWNDDWSYSPSIAVDNSGNIHVVWSDYSSGKWHDSYDDAEIMYVKYSVTTSQWSNVTILSDGWNNVWGWNNESSEDPAIVTDNSGNVHVVWQDRTLGPWTGGIDDNEIMYVNYSVASGQWSNITIISDTSTGWNDDQSADPDIDIDSNGNIHVIWEDKTHGVWGDDEEIMWTMYSPSSGKWLNATVISDGYNNIWGWNTGDCDDPKIAVDKFRNAHAVWGDYSNGTWRSNMEDDEIMYAKYSATTGQWSNVTIISDGHGGTWWNLGESENVDISADDRGIIHVVWEDSTNGTWGTDDEIMYSNWTASSGWSFPIVVSDGYNGTYWNDGWSGQPAIATDSNNQIHIVWYDDTPGLWGTDYEIMYVKLQSIISDGEAPFPWLLVALIGGTATAVVIVVVVIVLIKRKGRAT
ncbi:MAG: hypothetical protein ACFE9I_15540 [Candidatus Hermodarchaeota archaeon]